MKNGILKKIQYYNMNYEDNYSFFRYNFNNMSNSNSNQPISHTMSSNSMKRAMTNEGLFKQVNIPIDRTFDSDAADPKVAARLASTEYL